MSNPYRSNGDEPGEPSPPLPELPEVPFKVHVIAASHEARTEMYARIEEAGFEAFAPMSDSVIVERCGRPHRQEGDPKLFDACVMVLPVDAAAFYELGLISAEGIPCYILKRAEDELPTALSREFTSKRWEPILQQLQWKYSDKQLGAKEPTQEQVADNKLQEELSEMSMRHKRNFVVTEVPYEAWFRGRFTAYAPSEFHHVVGLLPSRSTALLLLWQTEVMGLPDLLPTKHEGIFGG